MSISQIQPDGGVNPLKDQQVNEATKGVKPGSQAETVKEDTDRVELSDQAKLFQQVSQFAKELENVPGPNEGRIKELQDAIANGTLINDKVLNETAQRLTDQLLA